MGLSILVLLPEAGLLAKTVISWHPAQYEAVRYIIFGGELNFGPSCPAQNPVLMNRIRRLTRAGRQSYPGRKLLTRVNMEREVGGASGRESGGGHRATRTGLEA